MSHPRIADCNIKSEAAAENEIQSNTMLITEVQETISGIPQTITAIQHPSLYSASRARVVEAPKKLKPKTNIHQRPSCRISKSKYSSNILYAVKKLDDITNKVPKYIKIDDDFQKLGDYIAATLKRFPPIIAAQAEMSIHQVLHAHKLKVLKEAGKLGGVSNFQAHSHSPLSSSHYCSYNEHSTQTY